MSASARWLRGALLVAALCSGRAGADERPAGADEEIARAHFATGLSYYGSGRFEPAVREFVEAYRLSHRAELLYNIARAYEKLGDPARTVEYYRSYLAGQPAAPERREVARAIERFSARVATLEVSSRQPGAAVLLDGEVRGATPLELMVNPGKHEVVARRTGQLDGRAEVVIGPRQRLTLQVNPGDVPPPPPPRRWPIVVGVTAAAAVAAVVAALAIAFGGTDNAADARARCTGSCVLFADWP
jgi:tetratricopeptide (TPR) repeat protein